VRSLKGGGQPGRLSRLGRLAGRLGGNAARLARLVGARSVLGSEGSGVWLLLRLGPVLAEQPSRVSFGRERALAFLDVLRVVEAAREDSQVQGLVVRIHGAPLGWSQAASLRRALESFRDAGKPLWAWSESLDAIHYYLASAAERVELPPSGALQLVGLRTQQFFVRDLLKKWDIEPEVVRIGSHKAAGEMLTRGAMSPEQREQIEAWQTDIYDEWVGAIAASRGLAVDEVKRLIDCGPHAAGAAAELGLIDGCRYPDELEAEVPRRSADDAEAPLVDAVAYFGLRAADSGWRPLGHELPRVAYVIAHGSIGRGRGQRGIASQTFSELFARLRRDEEICGVVLRVDSPGGDAIASDLLHRAVERVAAEKPVVVSMGQVAASGGYYISAAAHSVLAEKATLTGSIGVVGGKLNLAGLYRRLGIGTDAVEHGEHAGLLSETRGFSPDERSALQREMRALYEIFVDRVARGRSLEPEQVERAAQGRVFSGVRALELGLIDAIGGPLEALAELRRLVGLATGDALLLETLPRRTGIASLRALAGASGATARARVHLD
jgi:protease-4